MPTIVVPLDGSLFAERAIRPACAMALRIEHCRVLLVICSPEDDAAAQEQLDDRASLFADALDIDTRIVDGGGDAADAIVSVADSLPDSLLCMATQGRSGLRAAVLGSVTKGVVARSTQPTVLVGPNCRTALLARERGRMLVCSDGSPLANAVVPAAATWGERLGLAAWVAEVVGPDENPEPAHEPHANREVTAATARLRELSSRLYSPSAPATTAVLHGHAGQSIAWFAERMPAALIAMATHGHSGLRALSMGSVATEVVRHAPCPVLVTRPR